MSATTSAQPAAERPANERSTSERKEPTYLFTEKYVAEKSEIARKFLDSRERLNANVDKANNFLVKRFYNVDHNTYLEGSLPAKTKELMGLVASTCLRCDDCIFYHAIQAYRLGVSRAEQEESLNVALIVGGSIVVPHLHRAKAMVKDYVGMLDPGVEPIGVERTVATKTEQIAVSGRIDRLDDRSGELVVVDYKTGRHRPSADEARSSLTLALYALAAGRVLRRDCRRVELHHLPTGQVVSWEHTDSSLDRQLRRAEDIAGECGAADEMFRASAESGRGDEVFPPSTGAWCGWCDYRAHCP